MTPSRRHAAVALTTAALLSGLALGTSASAAAVSTAVTYETVVLTGDAAPGTGAGVVFSGFGAPSINSAGQTAFVGFLAGPGVDGANNLGLWSEGSGSLGLVAREGDPAPGTGSGVVFSNLFNPVLNAAGQTAIRGSLTGTGVDGSNITGIWSEGSGTLGLVARRGDSAPGTGPGVVFSSLDPPVFNNAGQTAFRGVLTGTGVTSSNDRGIWFEGGGTLGLVVREGDAAVGTGVGAVFSDFSSTVLNGLGQTAFLGDLTGTGVDGTNDRGIWSEGSGTLGLVARKGDSAAGTGSGVVFSNLGSPGFNDNGQTAFLGILTGTGVDGSNNVGIWSEGSGTFGLIVRKGDTAEGTGPGVVFSGLGDPLLNGAGGTAFTGFLTGTGVDGTNNTGIWSESGGVLSLVAREGDAAEGTGPGVVFSGFLGDPVLNGAGQTAFRSAVSGTGVDNSNNVGIWATLPDGTLVLIAREGDLFDVDDNMSAEDLRTISQVGLVIDSGGEDGRATSFNDSGELAFYLAFTDGTQGIFLAQAPEPGSLAILAVAGVVLYRRRR